MKKQPNLTGPQPKESFWSALKEYQLCVFVGWSDQYVWMLKVANATVKYLQMNFNPRKIPYLSKTTTKNCRTAVEWKPSFFYRSGAAWSRLGVVLSMADTAESRLQNMAKYVASRFRLLFRLQNTVFVAVRRHGCVGGTPIALDRFNQTRFKLQCFLWRAPSLVEPCRYRHSDSSMQSSDAAWFGFWPGIMLTL